MIRKRIAAAIVILLAFLLQTTVFQPIKLADAVPNLLLAVTITYGYLRGRTSGLVIGFVCGLLLDCMYGSVIGLYAFIFLPIGFVVGFCRKIYFTDSLILPIVLIASGDFAYCMYFYITEFLMRGRLHFWFYVLHKFLPEILYTTLVGVLVYGFLSRLDKKFDSKRKEI